MSEPAPFSQALSRHKQEVQTALLSPLRQALQGTDPSPALLQSRPSFLHSLSRRPSSAPAVRMSFNSTSRQASISGPADTPGESNLHVPPASTQASVHGHALQHLVRHADSLWLLAIENESQESGCGPSSCSRKVQLCVRLRIMPEGPLQAVQSLSICGQSGVEEGGPPLIFDMPYYRARRSLAVSMCGALPAQASVKTAAAAAAGAGQH